ncbi:MAG: polysaccharide deacetylase family protein [Clostridia bacterium]|nr:polysaccharide deacetylase family protein [Clostridia bacterium]
MDNNDKIQKSKYNIGVKPVIYTIAIIFLVLVIVVEVVAIIHLNNSNAVEPNGTPLAVITQDPNGGTAAPADNTPSPGENTPAPGNETPLPGETETGTVTPGDSPLATQDPTEIPRTPTQAPKTTPSVTGIDEVAARIVDPANIDFSFLDGVSTAAFEDCSAGSYDWYCGAVKKDAAGNISYPWDRYPSTLNYLKQYGGIYRKNQDQKVVYLTFDCGYENGNTMSILDTLKEKNVQAIFFVTGGFIDYGDMTKQMMQRMLAEGHLIGSHTEHHKIMPTLSNEEFVEELNSVYRKLKRTLGDDFTMLYYRPPQGACTPRDLALANYLGYHTTFWAFAYGDYDVDNQPDPAASLQSMKEKLHPGCVFLLHAVSKTNATILGDLIDYIRAEGYEIRRIDQ